MKQYLFTNTVKWLLLVVQAFYVRRRKLFWSKDKVFTFLSGWRFTAKGQYPLFSCSQL